MRFLKDNAVNILQFILLTILISVFFALSSSVSLKIQDFTESKSSVYIKMLSRDYDIQVQYSEISSQFVNRLIISDIDLKIKSNLSIQIERLVLRYDFRSLIRYFLLKKGAPELNKFYVHSYSISFHSNDDSESGDFNLADYIDILNLLPDLSLTDGKLNILSNTIKTDSYIKEIVFDKSLKTLSMGTKGSLSILQSSHSEWTNVEFIALCNTQINSLWNNFKGDISIVRADSIVSLNERLDFLFTFENQKLKLAKKKDNLKIDVQGEIDFNSSTGFLSADCDSFSVKDIITFKEENKLPDIVLKSKVSGSLHVRWDHQFLPDYDGEIRVFIPEGLIFPEHISLKLNLEGNTERINILYGRASWKGDRLAVRGKFIFNSSRYSVDIIGLSYMLDEKNRITASGSVKGNRNSGTLKTNRLFLNNLDLGTLYLNSNYRFSQIYSDFILLNSFSNKKFMEGFITFHTEENIIHSDLEVFDLRLKNMFDIIESEEIPDSLELVGNYTLNANAVIDLPVKRPDSLTIQVKNVLLTGNKPELPEVSFECFYNNKKIDLSGINVKRNELDISGELEITFNNLTKLSFNAGILYNNSNYSFSGILHDKLILIKEQKYMDCMIIRNDDSFDFKLNIENFPIPGYLRKNSFYPEMISIKTSGKVLENKFPEFDSTAIIINSNFPYLGQTEIKTNLDIEENSLIMNFFQARSEILGKYQGQGAAELDYKSDINLWAEVTGEDNQNYRLAYEKQNDFSDLYLFAQKIPLRLLKKKFLDGSVDADIKGQNLDGNWKVTGLVNSDGFIFRGQEYSMTGNLTADENLVKLEDLNFIGEKTEVLDINLNYLSKNKRLLGKTENLRLKNFKIKTGAEWDIKIDTGYAFGNITVDPVYMRDQLFLDKKIFSMERKDDLFRGVINKGNDLMVNYNLKNKKLDLSMRGDMPLSLDLSGRVQDGYINYSVKNINVSADLASYFIPLEIKDKGKIFSVDEGSITGKCTVQGQSTDPEIYGTLAVSDFKASSPLILEDIYIDNAKVILQGRKISFLPTSWLTREKDNGLFHGSLDLEKGSPVSYDFHLTVSGKRGLNVKIPFNGIVLEGFVQSDISVFGNKESAVLTGDIDIIDSEITLGESIEFEKNSEGQGFELQTDLNLFVNKRVFAYIPNKTIPVIKASLKNGNSLKIEQNTLSGIFNLDGAISLDKGDINYFGRIFSIEEGYIQFNEDQINFNPKIYVRAVIDEQDELGDVEISLIYNDRLMNDFSPVFTSNPARTNEQIMSIMGDTFNSPLNSDAGTLTSIIGTGSSYATQLVLATPIEEGLRKWLNMDYVSLRTSLIENIVVLSQSDTETTLSQYLDNTSLSLGKSLTDDIQFNSELGITYNDVSYTENNFSGFEFNTEFSLEFTTPLFDLIWSIAPDNPDDLFVPDNTITIIKKFTY